jgi:hypothetical protein
MEKSLINLFPFLLQDIFSIRCNIPIDMNCNTANFGVKVTHDDHNFVF